MAIAYDNSTDGNGSGGVSSWTFSHTCSGENRILFVGVISDVTNDRITGVTYGGVAMTLVTKLLRSGDRYMYLYSLINPASGANNVVISANASTVIVGGAISYTGARQTSQPVAYNQATSASGTSLSLGVTITDSGSWMVGLFATPSAVTAGANTTNRFGFQGGTASVMCDSNGTLEIGSRSLTESWSTSGSNLALVASFAPVSSNFFQLF
jgi:hypothetical protein